MIKPHNQGNFPKKKNVFRLNKFQRDKTPSWQGGKAVRKLRACILNHKHET